MSIQSEIERVRGNIASAYTAVTELGGEVPSAEAQNSGNLAQAVQSIPLGSQLVSLEVDQPPEKVDYFKGETFNPVGLILRAQFSNGAALHLVQPFSEQMAFNPDGPLELGLEYITARLTWDGVEKTCLMPVAVNPYVQCVDWWETIIRNQSGERGEKWCSVAYGDGKFVAVAGYNYTSDTAAYSTDGTNWTTITMPAKTNWCSVTYGDGKFVAVSGYMTASEAAYSTDGINWTLTTVPESYLKGVTYGDGKFVAVPTREEVAVYSTDGINWTATTIPSYSWASVTYGNGKFVAVADYYTNTAVYSTDGINWTATTLPATGAWNGVTYGDGKFVAVGEINAKAAYSTDGINWTAITAPLYNWASVTYGDGKFVAVAYNNTKAAYSTDGINWTLVILPNKQNWKSVTYGDGKFVAVAFGSDTAACSSADGPSA